MTDWIGAVCTWVAGAVLVTSGILKLGTAADFRKALVAFQLPRWTWRDLRFPSSCTAPPLRLSPTVSRVGPIPCPPSSLWHSPVHWSHGGASLADGARHA